MKLLAALLLTVFLVGCPAQVDPPPVPEPPVVHDVNGNWAGVVESELEFVFPLFLSLSAEDGNVLGIATLPGEPVLTEGTAIGSVIEGVVTLEINVTTDDELFNFVMIGSVVEEEFSGEVFNLLEAGGTFSMTRP